MALSALFWIALIAAIIWGVARLTARRDRSTLQTPPAPTAEEILHQRYARGEIDTQTFEAMRERLSGASRSPELTSPRI